jgi:anti-sigma regulatory factor (Ser/Thr protein kinase)
MNGDTRRLTHPLSKTYLGDLRRWARSWMERQQSDADPDSVVLALTELVSNAVRHGADPVDLELSADGRCLLLQVSDRSDDLPRQIRGNHSWSGGRGMILLDALASRWGVQYRKSVGKTVWCEFLGDAGQPAS